MNTYSWLWILLGCVVTIVVPRLFSYFTRLHNPYPEDIAMFSQPLDWEDVKVTFDVHDARDEAVGRPRKVSLRMLDNRLAASYEYFKRMEHNAWLIELCGNADRRAGSRNCMAEAHETLLQAQAMLQGAECCETDAELPEYENQAAELRSRANTLRREAREQFGRAERIRAESEARKARINEAVLLAERFAGKVRLQFAQLTFLTVLLRLDKLRLLPAEFFIQRWSKGNSELLLLYQEARLKAAHYVSMYQAGEKLLARM
jgi:hypothetical protein